jgi:hypothetical protein
MALTRYTIPSSLAFLRGASLSGFTDSITTALVIVISVLILGT